MKYACYLKVNHMNACLCRIENEVIVCDCRDRLTGNDAVGSTYLNLSSIASSGGEIEGIVPFTYGSIIKY